ncbi:TetR/AcrR family transcriptional regulator [Streptomyces sp. LaPpAH-108]|uniref:TetR/AcrR family transcriptional regulator n=1 Tax=Streptomyces sp. LaPpAH-108 TaxID=1155714 RepID=UPI000370763E|nr:TetR/AcrR family transcriptional regulator [Streptomyces sp. LaPpAH-108]
MPRRSTYHHGDLKATLVTTALDVIAEQGVGALSVAEVARRAGVSSAAPYRHFASRKDLLIACAITAAHRLTGELRAAHAGAADPGDPVETLAAAAAVYTRFAAEHGSGFDLIYAEELRDAGSQELLDAGRGVMDVLLPAALAVTGEDAKSALQLLERQIAAAHGYAALLRSDFLARRHATVEDVASGAAAIARSLANDARRAEQAD